jgi:hypothetical protein
MMRQQLGISFMQAKHISFVMILKNTQRTTPSL